MIQAIPTLRPGFGGVLCSISTGSWWAALCSRCHGVRQGQPNPCHSLRSVYSVMLRWRPRWLMAPNSSLYIQTYAFTRTRTFAQVLGVALHWSTLCCVALQNTHQGITPRCSAFYCIPLHDMARDSSLPCCQALSTVVTSSNQVDITNHYDITTIGRH